MFYSGLLAVPPEDMNLEDAPPFLFVLGGASKYQGGVVMRRYPNCCTRGEIIALLYNHAVEMEPDKHITPEKAEELVRSKLGESRKFTGGVSLVEDGLIDEINGVSLNVYCKNGSIDVSSYPHGDGNVLIESFIYKRLSDIAKYNAQSGQWKPLTFK